MQGQAGYGLISRIVEESVADSWEDAVNEWVIESMGEDEKCSSTCLCGHERIRYVYTIRNVYNGNELSPIGSVCIGKFERDDLDAETKHCEQAMRLANEAAKLGESRQVDLKSGYFTRDLINRLRVEGAFPANEYNGGNGDSDGAFLLKMFNKRSAMTERQNRKAYVVIKNAVYPWLRDFWRETHDGQEPPF